MNYLEVLNLGNDILKTKNIKTSSLDSELLLAKVLKLRRERLLINLHKQLSKKNFKNFLKLIARRQQKEPIAYIFKEKEFWKYNFIVNEHVLIPRPETEIIVNEVLNLTNPNSSKRLLDVGTGSGCIILSILKERPNCYGTAIDISKKALKVAISNAKMHHLRNKINFINIDIDKFNYNKYDFVISNPPYINNYDLIRLDNNVRIYEPILALKAGIDGLSEIKKLINRSNILLKKNGKLIFEIGEKHQHKIMKLLKKNGYYVNKICKDLNYKPRVFISTKIN